MEVDGVDMCVSFFFFWTMRARCAHSSRIGKKKGEEKMDDKHYPSILEHHSPSGLPRADARSAQVERCWDRPARLVVVAASLWTEFVLAPIHIQNVLWSSGAHQPVNGFDHRLFGLVRYGKNKPSTRLLLKLVFGCMKTEYLELEALFAFKTFPSSPRLSLYHIV